MQKITIERTTAPKAKPTDETKLGFGKIFTDHMFIMNYDEGEGWHNPRIVPYAPIALDPAAMCLHYGQADFEGLKAYRRADGSIGLFRPDQNMARLNVSNDRLCIPKRSALRLSRLLSRSTRIGCRTARVLPSTFARSSSPLTPWWAFIRRSTCFLL